MRHGEGHPEPRETLADRSAVLALIIAVVILLASQTREAGGGTRLAYAFAGAFAGAGTILGCARFWPEAIKGRGRTEARRKCDEIRDLLAAEIDSLRPAEQPPVARGRTAMPVAPIRMARGDSRTEDEGDSEIWKAA
jgi:hypothetical protein